MTLPMLSTASIQSMLQEYYRGPVAEQLNQEVLAVEMFEKGSFSWAGKNVIIPLHTGRNTGVGYRGEAGTSTGTLPTAGQQIHNRIVSNATFLYGRFELSGPTMASASKGGMNSFVGALDNEMRRLVDDVRDHANINFFVGGKVRGLINEKKAGPQPGGAATYNAVPANQVINNAAGNSVAYQYDGDFSIFDGTWTDGTGTTPPAVNGVAAGEAQKAVRVNLVRLDTYEVIPTDAGSNHCGIFVTGFDKSARTITLSSATSNAPAAPSITTAMVASGFGVAVVLNTTTLVDGAGAPLGAVRDTTHEPAGILTNLCDDHLFNISRSTGSALNGEVLQSKIKTHKTTGTNDRDTFNSNRLQFLLDDIDEASGKSPNVWLVHNSTRQTYIAGAQMITSPFGQAVQQNVSAATAGALDMGYNDEALGYGGIKMRRSRHCLKGMFIALSTMSWKLAELKSGDFADLDGAILSRKANADAWEGFWRWYHQVVCCYPNSNGILFGFNLAT